MKEMSGPAANARMPLRGDPAAAAVRSLCPHCGLCCDGTLFADVRLQARDAAPALRALVPPSTVELQGARLQQPCPAFDGALCSVYEDRPRHCRDFACAVLQSVAAGKTSVEDALATVISMKRRAADLRALLRRLGDRDARRPLARRCSDVLSRPIDLATDDADLRGELLLAHGKLQERAAVDFLDPVERRRRPGSRPNGKTGAGARQPPAT